MMHPNGLLSTAADDEEEDTLVLSAEASAGAVDGAEGEESQHVGTNAANLTSSVYVPPLIATVPSSTSSSSPSSSTTTTTTRPLKRETTIHSSLSKKDIRRQVSEPPQSYLIKMLTFLLIFQSNLVCQQLQVKAAAKSKPIGSKSEKACKGTRNGVVDKSRDDGHNHDLENGVRQIYL
jgi:hypothetical protein